MCLYHGSCSMGMESSLHMGRVWGSLRYLNHDELVVIMEHTSIYPKGSDVFCEFLVLRVDVISYLRCNGKPFLSTGFCLAVPIVVQGWLSGGLKGTIYVYKDLISVQLVVW